MTNPPLDLEIHINEEGEIVLTELPEDLAQMVAELDPDHSLACALEPPIPPIKISETENQE